MNDGFFRRQSDDIWPPGTVTTLNSDAPVDRLMALVLPAIAKLRRRRCWVVWVAPPYLPSAQLLSNVGLSVSHSLIVYRREGVSEIDMIEQALSSRTNDVVLAWPSGLSTRTHSRLRRAARLGRTRGLMLLTDPSAARRAGPVSANAPTYNSPVEQLSLDVAL